MTEIFILKDEYPDPLTMEKEEITLELLFGMILSLLVLYDEVEIVNELARAWNTGWDHSFLVTMAVWHHQYMWLTEHNEDLDNVKSHIEFGKEILNLAESIQA